MLVVGLGSDGHRMTRSHPMATWKRDDVWTVLRDMSQFFVFPNPASLGSASPFELRWKGIMKILERG